VYKVALFVVLAIIYIISPVDLWPGVVDDVLAIITMILICGKAGINPYEKKKRRRHRRRH
jgi:uncharacterized membrane protein YkvA (DUF1232 family)